jgi:hypothetical protein
MTMTKRILMGLLALAFVLLPLAPAITPHMQIRTAEVSAQPLGSSMFWWFQLRDERNQPLTDTTARCFVYTAGSDTLATIYTDATLSTAAANPITAAALFSSQGQSCAFYTAVSVTSVDVIAWSKRARSRLSGYTPAGSAGHYMILDQQGNEKIIQIPFSAGASSSGTSYTNSGVTIPKGFLVRDVAIQVTATGAGSHVIAGILETDPKGFCASGVTKVADSTGGVTLATLGWLPCTATFSASTATLIDYYAASFHSGHLLSNGIVGAIGTHAGVYNRIPFVGDGTKKTVVYHVGFGAGICNANCGSGYLYIIGEELGNDY